MTETRRISEDYARIAQRLIDTDDAFAHIRESEAVIIYLASTKPKKSKGRLVFGECEKVADKNRWAIPADFTITLYDPNCCGMDEEHVARVLFHELLHVGISYDKDGNEVYSVVPHDFEDFRECVRRWGADWSGSDC